MSFLPPDIAAAPQARGQRPGLLTAASNMGNLTDHQSGGGVTFFPDTCGISHDWPMECGDESPSESPANLLTFDPDDGPIAGAPFAVYAGLECGSAGRTSNRMRSRVLLRLRNSEQVGVERNFSEILVASGAPELAPDNSTSIVNVVATLEQWLYGVQEVATTTVGVSVAGGQYGNVGYLHVTPRTFEYMTSEHLLIKNGPLWTTQLGTIVVPGGGYSGIAPGGLTVTPGVDELYITGQVAYWRDAAPDVPDVKETFDRTRNQWMAHAKRAYVVTYDCLAAAAPFDYEAGSI